MQTSHHIVIASVLLLGATGLGSAGSETYDYGPVRGYSFDIPVPDGSGSYDLFVYDGLPFLDSAYLDVCVLTDHHDGRGEDTHCGDSPDGDPDDISDHRVQGCGSVYLSGSVFGDLLRVRIRPTLTFVDETSGAMCRGSVNGTIDVTFS
ncbi:MAG: hypothetical protein KY455_00755 [Euryarchaeota archaeon]|nr:hypothetical protein [Euryarchaeota archaeon]